MGERRVNHFLLVFMLLFSVACSSSDRQNTVEAEATFQATVVEVENGLIVAPLETEAESKSSDLMMVGTNDAQLIDKEGHKINISNFNVGNIVEISYDGIIMESYPAQIKSDRVKIMAEE